VSGVSAAVDSTLAVLRRLDGIAQCRLEVAEGLGLLCCHEESRCGRGQQRESGEWQRACLLELLSKRDTPTVTRTRVPYKASHTCPRVDITVSGSAASPPRAPATSLQRLQPLYALFTARSRTALGRPQPTHPRLSRACSPPARSTADEHTSESVGAGYGVCSGLVQPLNPGSCRHQSCTQVSHTPHMSLSVHYFSSKSLVPSRRRFD
jgi:hypothetical protein